MSNTAKTANLKMHTPNFTDENIKQLATLFPHCVCETQQTDDNGKPLFDKDGKPIITLGVDFELLKQELSHHIIDGSQERYRLDWVGKRASILTANSPITKTLRPSRDESVDFDNTANLFIEGDNLDALKLLQKSYQGAVKMIYIDPPYNTGNDFIYNDDFSEDTDRFLERSGQTDEDGNRLVANTESNGRFHSDWLSMMYSRLKIAKNLLSDDGVIFISISDHEVHNLRKICDEIFGANNIVGSFVIIRSEGGGLAKHLVKGHDHLLVFARNLENFSPLLRPKDIRGKIEIIDGEEYWIEEDWLREEFGQYGTCAYEDIEKFYNEEKKLEIDRGLEEGKYVLLKKQGKTIVGRYRKISEDGSKFYSILKHLNKNGKKDLAKIGLDKLFSYPKPVSLIKEIILGASFFKEDKNALILDFFAGSSTTADTIMQLNNEDGGNRQFIMVQIPEILDVKNATTAEEKKVIQNAINFCNEKNLPTTIAEISKERIRRAGTKIKADNVGKDGIDTLDTGFRVLKIDSSNMTDVYYRPNEYSQDLLDGLVDNIKADRSDEDLLFGYMLDVGVPLSLPIERIHIDGHTVYQVGGNSLVASLDYIDTQMIAKIAKLNPVRFVSSERAIATDSDKTNIIERFKQLSHSTDVRFI